MFHGSEGEGLLAVPRVLKPSPSDHWQQQSKAVEGFRRAVGEKVRTSTWCEMIGGRSVYRPCDTNVHVISGLVFMLFYL